VQAAGAVACEREAVFERAENRFDPLADARQRGFVARLVFVGRAQNRRAVALARGGLEGTAGVARVAEHQLAAVRADRKQPQRQVAY
jgi:hypothetical protein